MCLWQARGQRVRRGRHCMIEKLDCSCPPRCRDNHVLPENKIIAVVGLAAYIYPSRVANVKWRMKRASVVDAPERMRSPFPQGI